MLIFMNKTDNQKLLLLKYAFHTSSNCTIESLSLHLGVSTRTVERYFKDLQTDCRSLFPEKKFTLDRVDGKIILTIVPQLSPNYILDRLHVEYTEKSIEFKLIHALLLKKYSHLNELADALFISPSTLYRLLNKLEPIIHKFNLAFSFFDSSSDLNFDYEEKNLRAFTYYFYWTSLKGIHIEPLNRHKEMVAEVESLINWHDYQHWLPSKKEQIRYICAITAFRQNQSHHLLKLPKELQEILQIFTTVNDLSFLCQPLLALTTDDPERLFFNLFLRLHLSDLDSSEQKQQIVHQLMTLDSSLIKDCQQLLNTTCQAFNLTLSDEVYETFFYYYMFILIFIVYFDIVLPDEFKEINNLNIFGQNQTDEQTNLFRRAQTLYQNCKFNHPIPDNHQLTIIGFICIMVDTQMKVPLNVTILYSKSLMGDFYIQKRLTSIFSSDVLQFISHHHQADLIISDCFAPDTNASHFFYLDSLTDPLRWEILITHVKDLIGQNSQH